VSVEMLDCVRLASMHFFPPWNCVLKRAQLRLICAKVSATAKSGLACASFVDNQQIPNATFKNITMRLGVREVIERGLVLRASFQGAIRHILPNVLLIVVQIRKLPPIKSWLPPWIIDLVKYSHSVIVTERSLIALFPFSTARTSFRPSP
jgi:hypothetical protein